jgi:hypothetical protein
MENNPAVLIPCVHPVLSSSASREVPALALSSLSDENESKRQQRGKLHHSQDAVESFSNLSVVTDETEDITIGPESPSSEISACGVLLSADLGEEFCEGPYKNHKSRQSSSRIPSSIILLEKTLPEGDKSYGTHASTEIDTHRSSNESIEERLKLAETLLESYRNAIQSNEHLVDSLYNTLLETQEQAQNLLVSRNELLKAVDTLYKEKEDVNSETDRIANPRIYLKMAMSISLLFYILGMTSEYALVAAVLVYLLEDIMESIAVIS